MKSQYGDELLWSKKSKELDQRKLGKNNGMEGNAKLNYHRSAVDKDKKNL